MLLDDGRAQGGGSHRDADAHGVVGESDLDVEHLLHRRHAQQVCVVGEGRVRARAREESDIRCPAGAGGFHGVGDLGDRPGAHREDHGLAGLGDLLDEGEVDDLERGDLVERNVERLEEVDCRLVERRAEGEQPELAAAVEDRLVPLPRRVRL